MNHLTSKLLLIYIVMAALPLSQAEAELPELPIKCWARTEVQARISGFADKILVVEDTYGNALYGFDTGDCSEQWTVVRAGFRLIDSRISDGVVFARFFDEAIARAQQADSRAAYETPGKILAIDAATGDILWETETLAGYSYGFTVAAGVVVLDGAGRLEVFRASDGRLLWTTSPMETGWFFNSPWVAGNTLVRFDAALDGKGHFLAHQIDTGELLWDHSVLQGGLAVIVDSRSNHSVLMFLTFTAIGGSPARVLIVLDPVTGAGLVVHDNELAYDAVSDGDQLFYFSADSPTDRAPSKLKSIDLQTRAIQFEVDVNELGSLAGISGDSVIAIDDGGADAEASTMFAFSSSDGGLQWSQELKGSTTLGMPAYLLSGDDLILANDERFAVVDVNDGSIRYEALLPILKTGYSISDTGWCPDELADQPLQESGGTLALMTCANSVAIIDRP